MASSSSTPTSPTSPSPSSSAIPIIRPGKSILKRPPPPQRGFFSLSTLSKLLPTSPTTPTPPNGSLTETRDTPLKRAHFILPQMSTVYPISSASPPYTPNIKEEKRGIEEREAERRRRIVRSNSLIGPVEKEEDGWWSLDKVGTFYAECCVGREELANPTVSAALRHAGTTSPRSLDLSGIQLTPHAAAALSDILTIEWGLRKLVLRECDLDELTIKPMLHALLITNTLLFLSIASNRGMKASSFKLVGAYVAKAKTLQYLDLSQNALDKRSIESIVGSLGSAPPQVSGSGHNSPPASPPASPRLEHPHLSSLQTSNTLLSLRVDDCSLRPATLEILAHAVRTSPLRNISLRHNRITATGAVALALMIKDYPDSVPSVTTTTSAGLAPSPVPPTSISATPSFNSASSSPTPTHSSPVKIKGGPIPPPPRHPTVAHATPQTTYTPYIPKARRGVAAARASPNASVQQPVKPLSLQATAAGQTPTNTLLFGESVPLITSSAQGGVTTRHPPPGLSSISTANYNKHTPHENGPSAALLDRVRALDNLPRLGALRTLDLRGNDIRGGITYIAQVLKRNRTLKLLNLSENKIDVQGLVVLAEALKYNSCLETLDLSKNPCCGPGLEGIQSLRTAFTLNTSLKRLFLSSTSLTPSGAIALAEFLPESTSLLHLDLTVNSLDHAGVLALSVGLKANYTMRCLDLNIPAGNEEMARLCREILSCCVRNTEEAEKFARAAGAEDGNNRGAGKGVWGMIEESELARSIRTSDDLKNENNDVLAQARECKVRLEELFSGTDASSLAPRVPNQDVDPLLIPRTKALLPSLATLIQSTVDPMQMGELLALNDALTSLLQRSTPGPPSLTDRSQDSHQSQMDEQPVIHTQNPSSSNSLGLGNGSAHSAALPPTSTIIDTASRHESDSDDPALFSPRVDKGKGKAMEDASPVLQKLIMSPTFSITDSDEEDEEQRHAAEEMELDENGRPFPLPSPTDRSRSWVEEEGEIFRKGQALLSAEEMESEYAGEELRQGLLEAELERPPARQLDHEGDLFDEDMLATPPEPPDISDPPMSPTTPSPRPYVARQRSTSFDNSKT